MDRMPDSGSGDGGSSPLAVTNKTKSQKRKESPLSIFFFGVFVFQSEALEEGAANPLVFLYCLP